VAANKHVVAIIGGATSGAEAASVLSDHGCDVVVFEQNPRPFGKIEDGLPRWHAKQRAKEYVKIGEKLCKRGVTLVPKTRLGTDVPFGALLEEWGFSAVLLANGAWKDRPLPVPEPYAYEGKGVAYQNALVYWFNHYHEKGYAGEQYQVPEGVIICGGGLASFDVAKICMIETTQRKLRARGIEADMHDLEKDGVFKTCEKHGLAFDALGITPCTLYYRRRAQDMPISSIESDATPEQKQKGYAIREKILQNAMDKFGFRFAPLSSPHSLIVERGRVVGMNFERTVVDGSRVKGTGETYAVRSELTVSSIGSIPAPIEGVEMNGEWYRFKDEDSGIYEPCEGVFGVGNVITGKGNIRVSMVHGKDIAEKVARWYLGLDGGAAPDMKAAAAAAAAEKLYAHLKKRPAPSEATVKGIQDRVAKRHREIGYTSYAEWLKKVTPPDLE
jgi:NADPH-dependent glutamate synthase beta subunit-like oxidoreductase